MKTHYIYKITNHTTGEYYYGKRTCKGHWKDDPYMGSGVLLKNKMNKHPDHDWSKEVLLLFDTDTEAYEHERVVIGDRWRDDPLCLNLDEGGLGISSDFLVRRWQDPERLERQAQLTKERWQDPAFRERQVQIIRERTQHHSSKKRQSQLTKERWQDPKYKEQVAANIRERWQDPNLKKRQALARRSSQVDLILGDSEITVYVNAIRPYLRMGATFKPSKVHLHHDEWQVTIHITIKAAIRLILYHGFEYGKRRAYTSTNLKKLKADGLI